MAPIRGEGSEVVCAGSGREHRGIHRSRVWEDFALLVALALKTYLLLAFS